MSKIKTYQFTYSENFENYGVIRFCAETLNEADRAFKNWYKENGYDVEEYTIDRVYDVGDAEEYGIRYAKNPERAKLLHDILLNIGENFYYSGENDRKAFAMTDSEVAADALMETLYNLGFEIEGDPDAAEPDYKKEEFTVDGLVRYRFTEL